jgi:hypothetical protein
LIDPHPLATQRIWLICHGGQSSSA